MLFGLGNHWSTWWAKAGQCFGLANLDQERTENGKKTNRKRRRVHI
jgi:hypothetical protein